MRILFDGRSDAVACPVAKRQSHPVDAGDVASDSLPDLVVGNSSAQNVINYNIGVHIVRLRVVDNAGDSSETAIVIEAQSQ